MVYLEKSWMIKFFWECFLTSFIFHHKEEWEWRSLYLVLLRCLILFWAHSTTLKKATKNKKIPHEFHYFCTGEQWRYSHGHEMWNTNSSNFTPFAVSQFFAMTVICMSSYDKALLKKSYFGILSTLSSFCFQMAISQKLLKRVYELWYESHFTLFLWVRRISILKCFYKEVS